MTAQTPETVEFEGATRALFSEPLFPYLHFHQDRVAFTCPHTALYRGYRGVWAIRERKLFLVSLEGRQPDGSSVNIRTLFPNEEGPIFAQWYSGWLVLPEGNVLKYIHSDFETVYEREIHLYIDGGVLYEREEITNNLETIKADRAAREERRHPSNPKLPFWMTSRK